MNKDVALPTVLLGVVPILGLLAYLRLYKRMIKAGIPKRPSLDYFIVFGTYGLLLMILLVGAFFPGIGAGAVGAFYLLLGAPVVMLILAYRQFLNRKISKYHFWAFLSSAAYFVIFPVTFFIWYKALVA